MEETSPPIDADEAEPDADLTALRWQLKDAWSDGVTFQGRLLPDGVRLESRRMAGVPVRFALSAPMSFPSLHALVAALLASEKDRDLRIGLSRQPVGAGQEGSLALPVGDHPIYPDGTAEIPIAWLRKISREDLEIELPWRTVFAEWKVGKPIL